MYNKTIKPEIKVLQVEQTFYISVEKWNNNYFSFSYPLTKKEDAVKYHNGENPQRIIEFTLKVEDFKN